MAKGNAASVYIFDLLLGVELVWFYLSGLNVQSVQEVGQR